MLKWIKAIIFLFFAGFLVLGAVLQLESVREKAKQFIINKIESETGCQVAIESIRLFPSFQLTVRNIAITQDKTALLECEHLYIGIYPHELLSNSIHLSKLHIEGLNILNLPKQNVSSDQSQPIPEISFKLRIDDLFIENAKWAIPDIEPPKHPVVLRGTLAINPACQTYYSHFKFSSPIDSNNWLRGDIAIKNRSGSLSIQNDRAQRMRMELEWTDEGIVSIPRFLLDWQPLSLTGKLSFLPNGIIQDSLFYLSINDLSEISPLSGSLSGAISILGSIKRPSIEMRLKSDAISGYSHTINQVQIDLSTLHQGIFDLKFIKNEHPYHFSSELASKHGQSIIPSQFDFRIPLEEVARLVNWDVAEIDGDLMIHAGFNDNNYQMRLEVQNGLLETFDMGARFQNIHAIVEGDIHHLNLTALTATDTSNGKYSGTGFLDLDIGNQFPFGIELQLENAQPLQSDLLKAALTGAISFSGNLSKAKLAGEFFALSPQIKLPEKLPERTDSIEITYVNQSEKEPKPTQPAQIKFNWPIDLSINLSIRDALAIKGGGVTSDWHGGISVEGTLSKPKTRGEIKLNSGYFLLKGKKFEFNQGSISFHGDPKLDTTLFLTASMDLTNLTILVSLKGPIINPSITLSSTPPMSQRAILSWLLFGKGISDINPMEDKQLSRSLRSLLDKVDSNPDLLTKMGDVLGLDQVEIGTSPTGRSGDLTVKVGKYLTEGTYLSVSRNISRGKDSDKNSSCFGIETKLGRSFRFRAEGDTETNGRLNLLWKKDY